MFSRAFEHFSNEPVLARSIERGDGVNQERSINPDSQMAEDSATEQAVIKRSGAYVTELASEVDLSVGERTEVSDEAVAEYAETFADKKADNPIVRPLPGWLGHQHWTPLSAVLGGIELIAQRREERKKQK